MARKYGVSHAAANALAVIEGNGGPLPAGDVSARMQVTSGTMTAVLDTLERKGLIQRRADPHDRRRVLVEVTPTAQNLLDRMLPEIEQLCTVALGGLTDDAIEALISSLATIRQTVTELPTELPQPKPRRTPDRLRRRRRS